jgi:hypothetical protein
MYEKEYYPMITASLNSLRRVVRLTVTFAVVIGTLTCVAQAQTPSALFQNATLTGSGSTITATRVPVALSTTLIIYVDITMQFNADSNGNLTMAAGYPQIVASPTLLSGGFKAGNYVAPGNLFNGKGFVTVGGPGVTDGGTTTWSLNAATGADANLYPVSATWWVGPIANNPYAARLNKAGITSTAYAYGVAYGNSCVPGAWSSCSNGILIGATQSGNVISLVSFTTYTGGPNTDSSAPVGVLSFTLVP